MLRIIKYIHEFIPSARVLCGIVAMGGEQSVVKSFGLNVLLLMINGCIQVVNAEYTTHVGEKRGETRFPVLARSLLSKPYKNIECVVNAVATSFAVIMQKIPFQCVLTVAQIKTCTKDFQYWHTLTVWRL